MAKIIIDEEGTRSQITILTNYLESFNAFLKTPLDDAEMKDWEVREKRIPTHNRRRGPSDLVGITIPVSTASYLYDPTLKSGNAKPGISFRLKTDMRFADVDMNRQFTLVGRTVDFHRYFDEKMKYQTFFYPQNGGRHTLKEKPLGDG